MAKTVPLEELSRSQIILEIAMLFGMREKKFGPEKSTFDASVLAEKQGSLHASVIDKVYEAILRSGVDTYHNFIGLLRGNIVDAIRQSDFTVMPSTTKESGPILRASSVPILEETTLETISMLLSGRLAESNARIVDLILAAYLDATTGVRAPRPTAAEVPGPVLNAQVQLHVARQMADGMASLWREAEGVAVELSRQKSGLQKQASKALEEFLSYKQSLSGEVVEAFKSVVEVQEASKSARTEIDGLKGSFEAQFRDAQGKADAFLDSLRAQVATKELRKHWNDRAEEAKQAWVLSGWVLAALFILVPAVVFANINALAQAAINVLAVFNDFKAQGVSDSVVATLQFFSKIIILTAPALLYFWVIRLVVRFNTRSMLLADDANQRSTILETYYRMIEASGAGVEERALVLQALTRPPPGHGGDSVEPPNFVDAIKALKPS